MTSEPINALAFDPIAEAQHKWSERWPEADRMAAATALIRVQRIVMSSVERAWPPLA